MRHRIMVQNRRAAATSRWGLDGSGSEGDDVAILWAAVDYVRGVRAMRDGALDVYGVIMVRTRYCSAINERSRIVYEGRTYQVLGETLHVDKQANTVQVQAQMIVDGQPNVSSSGLGSGQVGDI